MRTWLLTAPRWVCALTLGVPFGVVIGLFSLIQNSEGSPGPADVGLAVVVCLVGGAFFGVTMERIAWSKQEPVRAALATLPDQEARRRAAKASGSGPAPDYPAVREVALVLARHHAAYADKEFRGWRAWFPLALAVGYLLLGLINPWSLTGAGMFALVSLGQLIVRRRARARVQLLAADPDPTDPADTPSRR